MAKAKDKTGGGQSAPPADIDHVADVFKDMPALPLHPLLAHPTAAMVAATALGLGFATQMTGAFLGALHGAVEASGRAAKAARDEGSEQASPAASEAGLEVAEATTVATSAKPVAASQPKPDVAQKVAVRTAPAPKAVKTPAKSAATKKSAATTKVEVAPVVSKPVATKAPAKAKAKAAKPDDLKAIAGIGPKAEQMLNARGVSRFADIAGWSAADVKRIDAELGLGGRIGRDDWVGQAKALVKGKG